MSAVGKLEVGTMTLCSTCHKALVELKGLPHLGWWHFSTHDGGHKPVPMKWMREDW